MLAVNADNNSIKYKAIISFDKNKPYDCPGGATYTTTRTISDNKDNQKGRVTELVLKGTTGYFGFGNNTKTKAKAFISLPAEHNPACVSLFDALTEGHNTACDDNQIPRAKEFVSRDQPNKDKPGEVYPDSMFLQVKLGPDSLGCYTKFTYVEDGEEHIIFGNNRFPPGEEMGEFKAYVKECISDANAIKFLEEAYGVKINVTGKEKKVSTVTGSLKHNKKLMEPSEFADLMKKYDPKFIFAKFKPIYIRAGNETFASIVVNSAICEVRVSASKECDDERENCLQELLNMSKNKPKEVKFEDAEPDELEF